MTMFDGLMQAMSSGTMEERYLAMIAFLDKAESLSNEASPALNVAIVAVRLFSTKLEISASVIVI